MAKLIQRLTDAFTTVWLLIILAAMFLGSDGPFTHFTTSAWKAVISDTIHGVIALSLVLILHVRLKRNHVR